MMDYSILVGIDDQNGRLLVVSVVVMLFLF